jgi:FixJ family two-component response regulator
LEQEQGHIDLVITDVVMPGISGGDLGSRLAELYPTLPVLYTSGFADDDVIRRGLMDASRPFLQKPFAPADLARKVREVLDSPAAREHRIQTA